MIIFFMNLRWFPLTLFTLHLHNLQKVFRIVVFTLFYMVTREKLDSGWFYCVPEIFTWHPPVSKEIIINTTVWGVSGLSIYFFPPKASSSSSSKRTDSTNSLDCLSPSVPINHCSSKVLLTVSSIRTEPMNISVLLASQHKCVNV